MPCFAPLTKISHVWSSVIPRILRRINFDAVPFLQTIGNPLRVRTLVENWATQPIAALTPLVVNSGIVTVAMVHSDGNGNLFARPAVRIARDVFASKTAHDMGIIRPLAIAIVVGSTERQREVVFVKQIQDILVELWEHGPRWWLGLASIARHSDRMPAAENEGL